MTTGSQASGRLADRIAIVTGGASGIGRQICLAYANEGATVVVADLNERSKNSRESDSLTHQIVERNGGRAIFVQTNIAQKESVANLVDVTVETFGRLDIMVNNAGISPEVKGGSVPIWQVKDLTWEDGMQVNCTGTFFCVRAAAAQMVKQDARKNGDRGWIINMASTVGLASMPNIATYSSTKHLIMGLTKSAALDLGPYNVHVNAICPGYVNTDILESYIQHYGESVREKVAAKHPLKGIGQAEDVAKIAVFLASDDAAWVSGTGITVDGAMMAQQ